MRSFAYGAASPKEIPEGSFVITKDKAGAK